MRRTAALVFSALLNAGTGQSGASVFEGNCSLAYTASDGSSPDSLTIRASRAPEPAILRMLRRLPILGPVVPVENIKVYGRPAAYRVRLLAACARSAQICDDAVLLGSHP